MVARRAGIVVQVGMLPNEAKQANLSTFISKAVQYGGSFRFDDEIDEAITLLASDPNIQKVITHVVEASKVVQAFEVAWKSQTSGKVVVWHRPVNSPGGIPPSKTITHRAQLNHGDRTHVLRTSTTAGAGRRRLRASPIQPTSEAEVCVPSTAWQLLV